MQAHGVSREQLAARLPIGIRTLQSRFKGTAQWTLDELDVLVGWFFVGNFGAMLNESDPIQDQLREKIAEEVSRQVAPVLADRIGALERLVAVYHSDNRRTPKPSASKRGPRVAQKRTRTA